MPWFHSLLLIGPHAAACDPLRKDNRAPARIKIAIAGTYRSPHRAASVGIGRSSGGAGAAAILKGFECRAGHDLQTGHSGECPRPNASEEGTRGPLAGGVPTT